MGTGPSTTMSNLQWNNWDGNRWLLKLKDRRHGVDVVHDEQYASAEEAQDAALAVAQHHINVAHNDTLLHQAKLTWHSY